MPAVRSAMRIAVVSSHPIQYNAPLFRELSQRPGIDLRVFYGWEGTAQKNDPEFGKPIDWDIPLLEGYEWEVVPNRARDPGTHHFGGINNPEMISRIENWGVDAVLVYGWAFRTHLGVMRHFKGRRLVMFRGDSTLRSGAGGRVKLLFRRAVLRWVYRNVDIALYPGQMNHEYLRACGVGEDRMAWMPHAIDTARFGDADADQAAAVERAGMGIGEGDIAFLFAGKFVPRKECGLLIAAFREVASHDERIHLVMVGDGPLESELRAMATNFPRIHFLGFRNQTQMPTVYRIGDCFVLPSNRETWGLGVNEAMASARPVIASDSVGAAPDLVRGKQYGEVFSTGSVIALAAALRRFILPRDQLRLLGEDARVAMNSWSIPAASDALLAALRERNLLPL